MNSRRLNGVVFAAVVAATATGWEFMTARTARGDAVLLQDDFSDNSIDASKWTTSGVQVQETGGMMQVLTNATNNGGVLTSQPVTLASRGIITITNTVYLHRASSNSCGTIAVRFGGLPWAAVDYADHSYSDSNWVQRYGVYLDQNVGSPNDAWSHAIGRSNAVITGPCSPVLWDTWVNESITYAPDTGIMKYYVNSQKVGEQSIGIMPSTNLTMQVGFRAWGWYTGNYEKIDSVSVTQATPTFTPPSPLPRTNVIVVPTPYAAPASDLSFALPFVAAGKVYLTTEAGGVSSSNALVNGVDYGYFDPNHSATQAYYALDMAVSSGVAEVVAAKGGKIVNIVRNSAVPYVLIDNNDGYFTKYQEFEIDPALTLGDVVQGAPLGVIRRNGDEHLHFQVAYDASGTTTSGVGFSHQNNPGLTGGVTVGGLLLDQYKLYRDTTAPSVNINGATGPLPVATQIVYSQITGSTSPVALDAVAPPLVSSTGTATVLGSTLSLHTGSPVWISSLIDVDSSANFLSFYADFTSASGAEGLLTVYWDGQLIGTLDERFAPEGRMPYSFAFSSDYAAGEYSLAFRLDPYTDVQSSVNIDGVGVGQVAAVPEPASLCLLGLGAVSLLRRRTR